jgi:isoquinoline 1-oxidoreductase alpha subunit
MRNDNGLLCAWRCAIVLRPASKVKKWKQTWPDFGVNFLPLHRSTVVLPADPPRRHRCSPVSIHPFSSSLFTTPEKLMLRFHVNGEKLETDVPADTPLLWFLRDKLELTGTKFGCGMALCGACTVHVDGQPIRSCSTPISAVAGKKVTTIEAIGKSALGKKVQEAWLSEDVVQCGYCQSGQIMSAVALLTKHKSPSDKQIDEAMSGNICRCGTYNRVRAAIKVAAGAGAKPANKPAAKAKA